MSAFSNSEWLTSIQRAIERFDVRALRRLLDDAVYQGVVLHRLDKNPTALLFLATHNPSSPRPTYATELDMIDLLADHELIRVHGMLARKFGSESALFVTALVLRGAKSALIKSVAKPFAHVEKAIATIAWTRRREAVIHWMRWVL